MYFFIFSFFITILLNCSFNLYVQFLLTTANGTIQLWSPKSEVRSINEYCLFMIGECNEHIGIVLSMDLLMNGGIKAVTGSSDCCIKVNYRGFFFFLNTYK